MKEFIVYISMIAATSEEQIYHKLKLKGKNAGAVQNRITRVKWFPYINENYCIVDGVKKVTTYYNWIQVSNISDISIREAKEDE